MIARPSINKDFKIDKKPEAHAIILIMMIFNKTKKKINKS